MDSTDDSKMKPDSGPFLLALDPGRRKMAWAVFEGKQLFACGLVYVENLSLDDTLAYFVKNMADNFRGMDVCERAVVERMKAYNGKTGGGTSNDLLDLQALGSACGAKLAHNVEWVFASEWKGSRPKPVVQRKIWDVLSVAETAAVNDARDEVPKDKFHDVMDAVGIGLHAVGRLY